ncbi:MAG: hypothetical protein KGJ61_10555 [Candidatus Omnitrophica bacterium]|nr:hypothetical protein [Candidatus Omnitrophota bacterium]
MSKQNDHYTNLLKGFNVKAIGRKPTEAELAMVHTFARPGKQALALALMARETGVTGSQIVMACGAPQLNKMRDLVAKGYFKRVPAPITEAGHTVYQLALTAKGTAKVKAAEAAAVKAEAEAPGKPAKAKRKAKAKAVQPVEVQPVEVQPVEVQPVA